MFCHKCGKEQSSESKFCSNCGANFSTVDSDKIVSKATSAIEDEKALFYSQNWERTRVFTLSILPRFDILITKQFLYLIELPKSLTHDVGGVMLGALGQTIANSAEKKAVNKVRSTWLDSSQQLISQEYKKLIFLKIPNEKLKESLLLKKFFRQRLAIFTYNNQKITLQDNTGEYERFCKYIKSI